MKVWKYLEDRLKTEQKQHFTLIDPAEQSPKLASKLAQLAEKAGTDAILIGGSYSVKQKKLDETIQGIKEKTKLPVILFPSSAKYLSRFADAILFMSLLNSKSLKYVIEEPRKGAPIIEKLGIETIAMGYLVIKPGMKVGKKGKAKLVKRDDVKTSVEYALFAKHSGKKLLYLEAGSGAPEAVTNKMIKAVKKAINIPLIVGGGIRNSKIAKEKISAGADIIVTGNIVEEDSAKLGEIISAVKNTKGNI